MKTTPQLLAIGPADLRVACTGHAIKVITDCFLTTDAFVAAAPFLLSMCPTFLPILDAGGTVVLAGMDRHRDPHVVLLGWRSRCCAPSVVMLAAPLFMRIGPGLQIARAVVGRQNLIVPRGMTGKIAMNVVDVWSEMLMVGI